MPFFNDFKRRAAGGPYVNMGTTAYLDDKEEAHRDGDQPAVITENGDRGWYQHGKLHRIGKPAIEHKDGGWEYFENCNPHRYGAPAVHRADGTEDFYLEGKKLDDKGIKAMFDEIARKEGLLTGAEVVAEMRQGSANALKPLRTVKFKQT